MMFGWAIQEEIPIQEIIPHWILAPLVTNFGPSDLMILVTKIIQLKLIIFSTKQERKKFILLAIPWGQHRYW